MSLIQKEVSTLVLLSFSGFDVVAVVARDVKSQRLFHFYILFGFQSELRTILKDGAIPTIFDFPKEQTDAQNSNRKRKIQAVGF